MSNWTDVAAEADLFEGAGMAVTLENHDIAIFKLEEGVYAINNDCSHGNFVECPFHQAMFDVRNGSVQCGPATEAVKSWPVKIENGRVFLNLTI